MDLELPSTEDTAEAATLDDIHSRARSPIGPALAVALDDSSGAAILVDEARSTLLRRRQPAGLTIDEVDEVLFGRGLGRLWRKRGLIREPVTLGEPTPVIPTADPLAEAVAALPPRQRSALVAHHVLDWSVDRTARTLATEPATIELRLGRAIGALGRDSGLSFGEIDERLGPLLRELASTLSLAVAEPEQAEREARRRSRRNRVLAVAGALCLIAVVGGIARVAPVDDDTTTEAIETVAPPRASQQPHAPIADGSGGFVALNRAGGRIIGSADGVDWHHVSRFNANELDLRLFVERFFRSGDRYLAMIESTTGGGVAIDASDQPRIAVSDDLRSWQVIDVIVDDLPDLEGLRPRLNLVDAAMTDDTIVAVVDIDYDVDYRAHRIDLADVCSVAEDRDGITVHRCSGESVTVVDADTRRAAGLSRPRRLLISDEGRAFVDVAIDRNTRIGDIFTLDGAFGMIDASTSEVRQSVDGRTWDPVFDLGSNNRLGLVAGNSQAVVVVSPSRNGWTSHRLLDGQVVPGTLPVDLDPTAVWLKPEFVGGPAGWAMFVTTSRPWERSGDPDLGWAVHTGEWIVELLAGQGTLVVRGTSEPLEYRYRRVDDGEGIPRRHPDVERGLFGGVRIKRPGTDEVLVEVSGDQIRESWVTGGQRQMAGQGSRFERDGFAIEGSLRAGPLTLERPDGSTTTYDDGFEFTDGDTSDGVEADLFVRDDRQVRFFRHDGTVEFEVGFDELGGALDPPAPRDADEIKALVVWSPDGVRWEIVWTTTRDTWYGSVAVGDDELLISSSGLGAPAERVELESVTDG